MAIADKVDQHLCLLCPRVAQQTEMGSDNAQSAAGFQLDLGNQRAARLQPRQLYLMHVMHKAFPDQDDIAVRVEARGAGLSVPPTASELEIAGALNQLIKEPHFRVSARRLGDAIAGDIKSERLVGEMEEIVTTQRLNGRIADERLLQR